MSGSKKLHHFEEHFFGEQAITITISGPAILQERQEESFIRVQLKLTTKIQASTSIENREATTFSV